MNHAETVAKIVIETLVPGATMRFREDQSVSVHDFDLIYSDGATAVVEVTAAIDRVAVETVSAISNPRRGGRFVKSQLCQKAWRIRPRDGANINKLRQLVDRYLYDVEASGIESFGPGRSVHDPAVRRIDTDLGVFSGHVNPHGEKGFIAIAPPICVRGTPCDPHRGCRPGRA